MNARIWVIAITPFVLGGVLGLRSFAMDLNSLLTLFLPVVWSILFTLGGAIVFMRTRKSDSDWQRSSDESFTKSFIALSIVLSLQTVFFLLLALMYPIRTYLVGILLGFDFFSAYIPRLICLYKALLFSLILIPSVFSLFIGVWILYLVLNPSSKVKLSR